MVETSWHALKSQWPLRPLQRQLLLALSNLKSNQFGHQGIFFFDDIVLIWHHGEEKLHRFMDFLNQAHPSIKFTADWSREKINFLDFQVIREGDRLITDLFTKPTDTHQLLHRTSCHPGHTKKGIPYSQALRIRRICSEDRFFDDRVGELNNRGYGENEVLEQISKVRGRDRLSLLDRQPKTKDDKRIPLVLTYHPALSKVYEILKENSKLILVDEEHKEVFQNKIFCHFGGPKISKINLLGLNYRVLVSLRWLRVPTGAMAGKVAKYAKSSRRGIVLKIRTKTDLSKTFRGGITAIQKT